MGLCSANTFNLHEGQRGPGCSGLLSADPEQGKAGTQRHWGHYPAPSHFQVLSPPMPARGPPGTSRAQGMAGVARIRSSACKPGAGLVLLPVSLSLGQVLGPS